MAIWQTNLLALMSICDVEVMMTWNDIDDDGVLEISLRHYSNLISFWKNMAILIGIDGINNNNKTRHIGIHLRYVEYEPMMVIIW